MEQKQADGAAMAPVGVTGCASYESELAIQVLRTIDFDGLTANDADKWDGWIEGELLGIKHYMRENNISPGFARIFFDLGVSAYLKMHEELPRILPMPFRKADGSPWTINEDAL